MERSATSRLALIASLPMLGAVIGAGLDEYSRLGFTTWRSACLAAGLALSTLVHFTLELLPLAVIGLLLGGCAVLALALIGRGRDGLADRCLAAHLGCALTLPLALLLCASALPLPLMLAADAALATLAAWLMLRWTRPASRAAGAYP